MGRLIRVCRIRVLNLQHNNLTAAHLKDLVGQMRQCQHLQVLDLSCNQLSGKVGTALGRVLQRCYRLSTLNLSNNPFGDEGVGDLCSCVEKLGGGSPKQEREPPESGLQIVANRLSPLRLSAYGRANAGCCCRQRGLPADVTPPAPTTVTDTQGGIRNRRNLEWRNLAQQNCTKLCRGILRSQAIFLGFIFVCTLPFLDFFFGKKIQKIVPTHFALQGPIQKLPRNDSKYLEATIKVAASVHSLWEIATSL